MAKRNPKPQTTTETAATPLTSGPVASLGRARRRPNSLPKLIEKYYADLADLARQNVFVEMGTRTAFFALLHAAGREHGWTLIAEQGKKVGGKTIRPDGTFKDEMYLVRGYWEAKDTADKLDVEIEKKRKAGYPLNNIIFEDTATAVLYQHGQRILTADMHDPVKLAELITEFYLPGTTLSSGSCLDRTAWQAFTSLKPFLVASRSNAFATGEAH